MVLGEFHMDGLRLICGGLLAIVACGGVLAQDSDQEDRDLKEVSALKWKKGPCDGRLGMQASIKVPAGYTYLDGKDTQTMMLKMHNPVSHREAGLVAPTSLEWFVVFEYDDCGHVQDDEKGKLDANAILESLKEGNESGNEERKRNGWDALELVGWQREPFYNEATHNLEWATKLRSKNGTNFNHNIRILGRTGVMEATLVGDDAQYDELQPQVARLLEGFKFNTGSTYSEFKSGDKIAQYGLTALITGGAAAVALKTGLFAKLWKFIALIFIKAWKLAVIAVVAVVAFFKKIISSITGRRESRSA